ncbi:aldehyde dehydrogenase family protein [Phanerochaete sordida]|uniref:Aldehyde dehydrogenase n=1 Tax=Phanerochaete sordida TaxID=48140 RepID=A0A9P3G2G8_9APHY|nr:aldehyde dehydrogenase family protein [Phanerochaete sordida]
MSADLQFTPLEEIQSVYARVNATFKAGTTRPLSYRRHQLLQLARMLQENITAWEDASLADLGKQRQETTVTELTPIIQGSINAAESLEEWATPEKPKVEAWRSSWNTTIYHVPKGIVLLISPWNYPVILTFLGLIGAIAAGCPTVLKPSECTPHVAALIAELIPRYLDPAAYAVVNGAVDETKTLLDLQWAHIFFTGSTRIGRIVATAAAKHVTPVTLELGGKSPVIIAPDYDLELAAKRVLYGKVQNVGQLCVSPDYVLVPRSVYKPFLEAIKKTYASFFPVDPLDPEAKWGKIVNEPNYKRVKGLIGETKGEIILGGKWDDNRLRIALTIVAGVKLDDPLMDEEIFGPILPIIEVDDVDAAIQTVSDRPYPLVVYTFTNSKEVEEKVATRTNSGTIVMNDTQMQLAVHEMPFGGHGESGYGGYMGKDSYDIFTHRRGYINVPQEMEPFYAYRYLPYSEESYKVMTQGAHVPIPES